MTIIDERTQDIRAKRKTQATFPPGWRGFFPWITGRPSHRTGRTRASGQQ